MIHEFIERTGYEPSFEEYKFIEGSYYEFDGQKDEFCKWFKKALKNGEWAKELKLRNRIKVLEDHHEAEIKEEQEKVEFYEPFFDRALNAENILLAIGKENVNKLAIKCKDERTWRKFENVKVNYIDNGAIRFINVVEKSGWVTSIKIVNIEHIDATVWG